MQPIDFKEELTNLRFQIDRIDAEIIALCRERLAIAQKIGLAKQATGLAIRNFAREAQVLENYRKEGIEKVGKAIIEAAVAVQASQPKDV